MDGAGIDAIGEETGMVTCCFITDGFITDVELADVALSPSGVVGGVPGGDLLLSLNRVPENYS